MVVAVIDPSGTRVVPSAGTDPNMRCEIGSVTKMMTAALVLQPVARGDSRLDDPVASCVTDFDEFTDSGDGDDCLARYVRADLRGEVWDAPGTRWSYSNGGYSLLGRLVEVLDGRPF